MSLAPHHYKRVQVFVDECTRWAWIECFRTKQAEEFTAMLERAEARIQIQQRESCQGQPGSPGVPLLAYLTDNAAEFTSRAQRRPLCVGQHYSSRPTPLVAYPLEHFFRSTWKRRPRP